MQEDNDFDMIEHILGLLMGLSYQDQMDILMKTMLLCISENNILDDDAYVKALGKAQVLFNHTLANVIKDTLKKPMMN